MIVLDDWQKEILATEGNKVLCSGRQVGKSTIISIDAGQYAANNPRKSILVISATERQADELFNKILYYIQDNFPRLIKKGKDRPTKHILRLSNGSVIRSLPTGASGVGIRGFTTDRLIVDECAFIPDTIFEAVTPQLLTTGGDIHLVSTPHGKEGYFYRCFKDPNFKVFHINSEQVIRERPISVSWTETQREKAISFLEQEKRRMTAVQYAQEYLGEFVDSLRQWFNTELIKKCMTEQRPDKIRDRTYFLGVDVARMGEDESTFEIIDRSHKETLIHVESMTTTKTRLTETFDKIKELDKIYNFKKIYIDDNGVGSGVFDFLLRDDQTKRKVIAINNSSRPLDRDEKRNNKLLKEDLYNNLLMLMEQGKIKFLTDDEIYLSLKSVQYEYIIKEGEATKLRIFGSYTHIVEGLIRAAWCYRDKSLNIWIC